MSRDLHPDPDIGSALRWLRQHAGLQQQELARLLEVTGRGVSTVWLSQVETGRRRPSSHLVRRLLTALGTDSVGLEELIVDRPWATGAGPTSPPTSRASHRRVDDAAQLARGLAELNAAYASLSAADRRSLLATAQSLLSGR